MTTSNEKESSSTSATSGNRPNRWGRVMAGTTAAAAVLGVSAYVITGQLVSQQQESTAENVLPAVTPETAMNESPNGRTARPSATPHAATMTSPAGVAATTIPSDAPIPSDVVDEIEEARRKMAEDGVPVKPPVTPETTQTAADIKMTTKGSIKEGGIVRMITARGDLTGQRELAYVAGDIKEYRGASCTQTFKFSNNDRPKKRDNLLMCWRTSAEKSVIAMVVDPKGRPSRDKAVNALEKNWRRLG